MQSGCGSFRADVSAFNFAGSAYGSTVMSGTDSDSGRYVMWLIYEASDLLLLNGQADDQNDAGKSNPQIFPSARRPAEGKLA